MKTYSFDKIVQDIGSAGVQMTQIGAAEGSAGNISVFVREFDRLRGGFPPARRDGPAGVHPRARRRLAVRERDRPAPARPGNPTAHPLCLLHIHPGGLQASLYAGMDLRPTSDVNSHLAIQDDQVARRRVDTHALVHAQPVHLTFLSHLAAYADIRGLNRRLLRWKPETVITFPEGIGTLPYLPYGSAGLMAATVEGMRAHRAVVWQRHGSIVTRSDKGVRSMPPIWSSTPRRPRTTSTSTCSSASLRKACRTNSCEKFAAPPASPRSFLIDNPCQPPWGTTESGRTLGRSSRVYFL